MNAPLTRKEKLMARLRELGADPKRSLGQNFLISNHVVERILAAVQADSFNELIEVGPGLGAITDDVIEIAREKNCELTLLELDRKFVAYWKARAESSGLPSRVVEGDALQMNWNDLALKPGTTFVSNLPYQISSSLVIERSLEPAGINRMILMFQKEVAQRIAAKARTDEYGLLTLIAQTFWETATVCDAGPKEFFPPPNVASRVLIFRWRKQNAILEAGLPNATPQGFLKFVKGAFSQRRKLMSRNLLGQFFTAGVELKDIDELLSSHQLKPTTRAEELDPPAFVRLYLDVVKKGWAPHGK